MPPTQISNLHKPPSSSFLSKLPISSKSFEWDRAFSGKLKLKTVVFPRSFVLAFIIFLFGALDTSCLQGFTTLIQMLLYRSERNPPARGAGGGGEPVTKEQAEQLCDIIKLSQKNKVNPISLKII